MVFLKTACDMSNLSRHFEGSVSNSSSVCSDLGDSTYIYIDDDWMAFTQN